MLAKSRAGKYAIKGIMFSIQLSYLLPHSLKFHRFVIDFVYNVKQTNKLLHSLPISAYKG